jgi:hypothetical protein
VAFYSSIEALEVFGEARNVADGLGGAGHALGGLGGDFGDLLHGAVDSSLAADCCSAAVAMEPMRSAASAMMVTISFRAPPALWVSSVL